MSRLTTHSLLILTGLLCAAPGHAYRLETRLDAGYLKTDWDRDAFFAVEDDRRTRRGASLSLYFKDVDNNTMPLAEAAFASRAGSFSLQGSDVNGESRAVAGEDYDSDSNALAAHIVIEDMIIWDLQAASDRYKPSAGLRERSRYLRAGIGSYFSAGGEHSLILYVDNDKPLERDVDGAEKTGFGLEYRNVLGIGSQHLAAGGGFAMRNVELEPVVDPGYDIEAGEFELYGFVRYYPLRQLGVFARLDVSSYAEEHDNAVDTVRSDVSTRLGLGVSYFPVQQFYLQLMLTSGTRTLNEEDDWIDEDVSASLNGAELSLGLRF
ncbi:MAG TPA: hypothetical protein VIN71_08570 [Pseudomonadales bacterium]